ncbi:hypothetical protein VKT23_010013 [Stygiomarasmius scandens]|uniref:Uncharacterized protein n=1 Tax=Marasmiellus scandens TaxID=2682957 RepID=A0ABR1JCR9_9AGAR
MQYMPPNEFHRLAFITATDYQRLKGYDPYTNSYAQDQGYLIFEFFPNFKSIIKKFIQEFEHEYGREGIPRRRDLNIAPGGGENGYLFDMESISPLRPSNEEDREAEPQSFSKLGDPYSVLVPPLLPQPESSTSMTCHTSDCVGRARWCEMVDNKDLIHYLTVSRFWKCFTDANNFERSIPHMYCCLESFDIRELASENPDRLSWLSCGVSLQPELDVDQMSMQEYKWLWDCLSDKASKGSKLRRHDRAMARKRTSSLSPSWKSRTPNSESPLVEDDDVGYAAEKEHTKRYPSFFAGFLACVICLYLALRG